MTAGGVKGAVAGSATACGRRGLRVRCRGLVAGLTTSWCGGDHNGDR
jgi:hypothetical protein